jgi:RNA polymerase sigma factor (sigma-70 family)
MIHNHFNMTSEIEDAELVARSLAGNRDAFGLIVSRYQNLVCSLAYSATGSLPQSEDVSQETFVTAWRQLPDLREPGRLRSWLCGIARNLSRRALRQQGREPAHAAESLEVADESPATEPLPAEQAINREEAAIMWRALEGIPEIYREPLILFYREQQSIERVAAALELSEDAVKQRLSRGRKMLQEQVAAFVEGALRLSAPGPALAATVLAALPLTMASSAKAAGMGAAAKGTAAAKVGGMLGILSAFLVPLGIIGGFFGLLAGARMAPTKKQRRDGMWGIFFWIGLVMMAFIGQGILSTIGHRHYWDQSEWTFNMTTFWWFYAMTLLVTMIVMMHRQLNQQRSENAAKDLTRADEQKSLTASLFQVVGMNVLAFTSMINLAWHAHDRLGFTVAITAMLASTAWGIWQVRRKAISKERRGWMQAGIVWVVLFAMLNWRVDVWLAAGMHTSLDYAQVMLPMTMVHLLTLALVAVAGVVFVMTKPKSAARSAIRN